jgi:hypothetical protein
MKNFLAALSGFRKLAIILLLIIIVTTLLLVFKAITADHFVSVINVCVPSYLATNVGEHFSSAFKDWVSKKLGK